MSAHFADRLAALTRVRGNSLCVGLDPRWDALPLEVRRRHEGGTLVAMAHAFEEFCLRVLDVVAPLVAVVKPQSAFFEACGPAGMTALQRILRRARQAGLITILDGKRNDIASTAEAYADAAFAGTPLEGTRHPVWDADALTVNPYLGRDAIEPFLKSARAGGACSCSSGPAILARVSFRIWSARASRSISMWPRPWARGHARMSANAATATSAPSSAPRTRPSWPSCAGFCPKRFS